MSLLRWVQSPKSGQQAAFPDVQGDAGMKFLIDNLSRDKVAFARDGFTERVQNGQCVSVRSPVGAPHDRGVEDLLTEEGGKVWAIVRKFGLVSSLRAVGAGLLGVRGARAVLEFPTAEVRTSVGSGSVPGMSPGTSKPCSHKTELLRVPTK